MGIECTDSIISLLSEYKNRFNEIKKLLEANKGKMKCQRLVGKLSCYRTVIKELTQITNIKGKE